MRLSPVVAGLADHGVERRVLPVANGIELRLEAVGAPGKTQPHHNEFDDEDDQSSDDVVVLALLFTHRKRPESRDIFLTPSDFAFSLFITPCLFVCSLNSLFVIVRELDSD